MKNKYLVYIVCGSIFLFSCGKIPEQSKQSIVKSKTVSNSAVAKKTALPNGKGKQNLEAREKTVVEYYSATLPVIDFKLTPEKYNIRDFKAYKGPSTRVYITMKEDFPIFDWGPLKENIQNIDKVLSSQNIKYFLDIYERTPNWVPVKEMTIVVSQSQAQEALSALEAATNAKLLKKIKLE